MKTAVILLITALLLTGCQPEKREISEHQPLSAAPSRPDTAITPLSPESEWTTELPEPIERETPFDSCLSAVETSSGRVVCLYRSDDGYFCRLFSPISPTDYQEKDIPLQLWRQDDFHTVYWAQEENVSFLLADEIVLGGYWGTIERMGDHLVYFPADVQLPKAFLNDRGEVILPYVFGWAETEDGLLVWYTDQYRFAWDPSAEVEDRPSEQVLGLLNHHQQLIPLDRFERIYTVSSRGALVVQDDYLTFLSPNGDILTVFDGWSAGLSYLESAYPEEGGAEFVFMNYALPDSTIRFRYHP